MVQRLMRTAGVLILTLLLSSASIVRNDVWRDEGTVWEDSITKAPRKARGYNELALHLISAGREEDAYGLLMRSLELNPYQGQIYINIGLALERTGRVDDAIRSYQKAIWVQPDDPTAYYNLGVIHYAGLRDRDKAFGYFLQARDRGPLEPDVHEYLGRIYREMGDLSRAREEMALHGRLKHR